MGWMIWLLLYGAAVTLVLVFFAGAAKLRDGVRPGRPPARDTDDALAGPM